MRRTWRNVNTASQAELGLDLAQDRAGSQAKAEGFAIGPAPGGCR